jgi:hypothetical protein
MGCTVKNNFGWKGLQHDYLGMIMMIENLKDKSCVLLSPLSLVKEIFSSFYCPRFFYTSFCYFDFFRTVHRISKSILGKEYF